ncbi:MAG: dTMP kinase [Candidatus Heimdallarchaeota archaeon]|nr:dTMP kinase [Candidatus Heimdallarchaeota archaeon]
MVKNTGLLIAFEGIDGTGKTTIAKILKEKFDAIGFETVIFKEPTNETNAGKRIRESYNKNRVSLEEELQWFVEDREWNVLHNIIPALDANKLVFLDRYYFSTACYQGARKDGDWQSILELNRTKFPEPDLTIIIELHPEIAIERIMKNRKKSNSFENIDYLIAVHDLFLQIYYHDTIGNYLLIDGSKSIEEIALIISEKIVALIDEKIKKRKTISESIDDDYDL